MNTLLRPVVRHQRVIASPGEIEASPEHCVCENMRCGDVQLRIGASVYEGQGEG